MTTIKNEYYQSGWDFCMNGFTIDHNGLRKGSPEWYQWNEGFRDAQGNIVIRIGLGELPSGLFGLYY